jgi:hypothetical protein
VFTLADLKKHYDAIGSYLHMPSLDQIEQGNVPDVTRLRGRCETVIALLDAVLDSRIFNSTLGQFSCLEKCMRCETPIRRRIPADQTSVEVTCFECKAEYAITQNEDGTTLWHPKMEKISCRTPGCDQTTALWCDEIHPGVNWKCTGCGEHWIIHLGIYKTEGST